MDAEKRQALKFYKRRSKLIEDYTRGEMSKREFIINNFQLAHQMSGPYVKVDSFEKALFNYQYYNCMAKHYSMMASQCKKSKKNKRTYNRYFSLGNSFYEKKDDVVCQILEILNYEFIQAYPIQTDSERLDDKLFEIVALKRKEAIFHSISPKIRKILCDKGLFDINKRPSLIAEYINDTY